MEALDEALAARDDDTLFHLPVTEGWLSQLTLALILVCHSSYRDVRKLLRDLFNISISVGTIHNRLQSAARQACAINRSQNHFAIRVGPHDEIFQGSTPVLAGVDAAPAIFWRMPSIGMQIRGPACCTESGQAVNASLLS